jgi:hypothetical protein
VDSDWHADIAEGERLRGLPTESFIGLTLADAERLAASEGRFVRVMTSLADLRHSDLVFARVNVQLDDSGRITAADAG